MSTALASLLKNSASALPAPLPARHTHTVLTHLGLGCDPSRAWLPPRQKLPDSDFHLVEACRGWEPTGFLGGSALPQPTFTPRTYLMGLSSSKGSCTPRSPGQSLSHWGGASAIRGLWGGRGWQGLTPPSTASGTAEVGLAGHSLSLPGLREGRSALCSVPFRLSGGSQAMRGGHGLCGQEAALGPMARTQQLVWALLPGHLHLGLPSSPLSCVPFTQWTLEHWSLLCHGRPGQERRGRRRSSLPHRSQGRTQSIYFG